MMRIVWEGGLRVLAAEEEIRPCWGRGDDGHGGRRRGQWKKEAAAGVVGSRRSSTVTDSGKTLPWRGGVLGSGDGGVFGGESRRRK
jgi:hypothetical protein